VEPARYVLRRPPCDWCSSPYAPKTATVETATGIGGAIARLCAECADLIGAGPRTPLRDAADMNALPTEAEVAAYLTGEQGWTFARTVPDTPHEYLLLRRSMDPYMHLRVVRFIRERGERRKWTAPNKARVECSYWTAGGREHWTMPSESDPILNRRVEP